MQLLVNLREDELRTYEGDGWAQRTRLGGAALSGLHTRPFAIDTDEQREIMGVTFRPGGAFPFFSHPADAVGGQHVELELLWGRDGRLLRERLLEAPTPQARLAAFEAAFLEQVVQPLDPSPDWARLAADFGYYDQAHLIHDFRTFSEIRPTAYRPRSDGPNHVPVAE